MSSGAVIAIVVVIIVVIAALAVGAFAMRRRRLRSQFGPEYDRVVSETGNRRKAESELADRQRRVAKLDIRPLTREESARYQGEWNAIQERFVDTPTQSVGEASTLVTTVMRERGYPADDDNEAMDALSVDYAPTLARYREARAISDRAGSGSATTDDLRNAMLQYRELFYELVEVPGDGSRAASVAPASDTPTSDTPVQDAPVQDAPVQDAPVQDAAPVPDAPVSDTRAESVSTETAAEPAPRAAATPDDAVIGEAASPQRSTRG
jgi:hypothetical protein